ncbi:MBL fold metallo-hydrolase [Thermodesulfatator atlanticus]
MKLTILGSGTGWPRLERGAPAYLLEIASEKILLDIGPGTIPRLLKLGFLIEDIDAIFLSHFHPDHVTDLIPFLFATRYSLGYFRQKPFRLVAGEGFSVFYQGLKSAFGHWVEPKEGLMLLEELSTSCESAFLSPPYTVRAMPVAHKPESLAYRFEHEGKSLVYSGDTDFCENIIELAKEAEVLILECSFPEGMKVKGHLIPSLCGQIAGSARVKKLILSHLYPPCDEADIVTPCQKYFSGEIVVAKDFLSLEI